MNKTIRRASVFTLLLVLALLGRATWVQFYESEALADNDHNRRKVIAQYAHPPGDIIVAGKAVTGAERTKGGDLAYKRAYVDGDLYSAVTGFSSQIYGATQLEGVYQDVLDGSDQRVRSVMDTANGEPGKPGNVITTIDPAVQKAAYDALGDKKGAAVAIDPASGEILGMVSTPSYDPGVFAGNSTDDSRAWDALEKDKDKPLVNRALKQALAPGSTFKLVVAAAALEDGIYANVDEPTDSPDPYTLPGTSTVLRNESASAPCENATLRTALQYSCNNVFAKLADDLGRDKLRKTAEAFGFNDTEQDVPVRAAKSNYPDKADPAQTGLTGIGQFEVTATPLQMAMVSATIANGGVQAGPHMASQVTDSGGDVVEDLAGQAKERTRRVVGKDTADQLRSAMRTVVEQGTGVNARIAGATVGGKTGTAQNGVNNSNNPYAWFTSYADGGDGKQVAVAVLVESSDARRDEISGNGLAAPIAKAMMQAALR
ncbi:peptidoglycan D,D-transpeptidase FtsI family protein [Streptomyces sp. NPDC060194]|uniref:peptidoglycan D,D-transpeptidase FtsI family protein n=1 Tax=Streptomyces sp. NPDC060194 TaxID=3347069 RepID=UPI0036589FEF